MGGSSVSGWWSACKRRGIRSYPGGVCLASSGGPLRRTRRGCGDRGSPNWRGWELGTTDHRATMHPVLLSIAKISSSPQRKEIFRCLGQGLSSQRLTPGGGSTFRRTGKRQLAGTPPLQSDPIVQNPLIKQRSRGRRRKRKEWIIIHRMGGKAAGWLPARRWAGPLPPTLRRIAIGLEKKSHIANRNQIVNIRPIP